MLVIVPAGAVTSMARNAPSLLGMFPGKRERIAVNEVAVVTDSVALMAPFYLWRAAVPIEQHVGATFLHGDKQADRLSTSIPSSSIQSSKHHSPSGSSDNAARVIRSE